MGSHPLLLGEGVWVLLLHLQERGSPTLFLGEGLSFDMTSTVVGFELSFLLHLRERGSSLLTSGEGSPPSLLGESA